MVMSLLCGKLQIIYYGEFFGTFEETTQLTSVYG